MTQHQCLLLCSAYGDEKKAVRSHGLRPQAERITRSQHKQVQLGHAWLSDRAKPCTTTQRRHADFDRFSLGRLESAPYASCEQLPHRVPDHALHRSPKKEHNRPKQMTRFGVTAEWANDGCTKYYHGPSTRGHAMADVRKVRARPCEW